MSAPNDEDLVKLYEVAKALLVIRPTNQEDELWYAFEVALNKAFFHDD
jgi:hypothetical protein